MPNCDFCSWPPEDPKTVAMAYGDPSWAKAHPCQLMVLTMCLVVGSCSLLVYLGTTMVSLER
jgi:hypothetical protein